MKKIWKITFALLMVFVITACSNDKAKESEVEKKLTDAGYRISFDYIQDNEDNNDNGFSLISVILDNADEGINITL